MSQKEYLLNQFAGMGFTKVTDIPEEMLDYLPENEDRDEDEI